MALGGSKFEKIFVNPSAAGEDLHQLLQERIEIARKEGSRSVIANLEKIFNLHDFGTDVVQLAQNLKELNPDKIVSLVNASDPDVTLGNHVGEYVNNWPHIHTTEENYTAMGSNGLCFESITGVLENPARLNQVSFEKGTIECKSMTQIDEEAMERDSIAPLLVAK